MKRQVTLSVLAIFSILGVYSCSKNGNPIIPPPPSEEAPNVLVPLAIGNSWSFRVITFDTTGSIVWVDTLTFFIRTDTLVNNVRWYLEGLDGVMFGQLGLRNDSIGHHQTNFLRWHHNYPYPAKKGQVYEDWIVESTDSLINTPLGQLRCYVYKYYWFGQPGRMICAPGIGWLHTENIGITTSGTVWLAETKDLVAAEIDSTTNQRTNSVINAESSRETNTRQLLHRTHPTTALPFIESQHSWSLYATSFR